MTLAAHNLLATVITARAPALCRLHTLAVDNRRCRLDSAPRLAPCKITKRIHHAVENTATLPPVKVVDNRRIGRKITRQRPPLTARGQHILDGVEDLAQVRLARTPQGSLFGQHRFDDRPFLVCHVAFVASAVTFIILPSGPVPRHVVSSKWCCNQLGIPHVGTTHDFRNRLLARLCTK